MNYVKRYKIYQIFEKNNMYDILKKYLSIQLLPKANGMSDMW